MVELLLKHGADPNATCGIGQDTALHKAVQDGHTRVIEILVDAGADINAQDKWGATPLDRALMCEHSDVAAILRRHGAKASDGYSSLPDD